MTSLQGGQIFFQKSASEAIEVIPVVEHRRSISPDGQVDLVSDFEFRRSFQTHRVDSGLTRSVSSSNVGSIQFQVDPSASIALETAEGEVVDAGFRGGEHSGCHVHAVTDVHHLNLERDGGRRDISARIGEIGALANVEVDAGCLDVEVTDSFIHNFCVLRKRTNTVN